MKKWVRRISVSALVILITAIVLGVVGWRLMHGTPDWYQPQALSAEDRENAFQRATNKLAMLQSEAAQARADERRAQIQASKPAVTRPANAITVSFTDDEINAYITNWSVWQSVRSSYERFLTDPQVVLRDGHLILAGRLKELDTIASLHFAPSIDAQGRLNLKLARVLAGKLPLPQATTSQYQKRAANSLAARLPAWRRSAAIDSTGIANSSAISAVMGELLQHVMAGDPADPVLFLPLVERGSIPVRLMDVHVENHTVTLVVCPMTPAEREQLVQKLRGAPAMASDEK